MKIKEVNAFVTEGENIVIINLERFEKFNFSEFLKLNPHYASKKIIFSPNKPKKSKEIKLKLPILTRFELLKEELIKKGLI